MPRFLVVVLLLAPSVPATALAQAPPARLEPTTISVDARLDFQWRAPSWGLLRLKGVQRELNLSDAQKKQIVALDQQSEERMQRARSQYLERELREAAINGIQADQEHAIFESLEPKQRDRLDQIQLQVQGPLAFKRREVQRRLGLSSHQIDQIEAIVAEGVAGLPKNSTVSLDLYATSEPPTADSIRAFVQRLEFQLAKEKARHLALAYRTDLLMRIAKVLSEHQQAELARMRGAPFDVPRLPAGPRAIEVDVAIVANKLGLGGQRADTRFNVKIAHPAYTGVHPRVWIDEAHRNFHTRSGRYKVFGDLVANDGYAVSAGKMPFTVDALKNCDILVIANATSGDASGRPRETKSAFTDAECATLEAWVKAGGSLLLVSDHPPYGTAAAALADRFGVGMSQALTLDHSNCSEGRPGRIIFTREKALLGDHPIARGRNRAEQLNRVMTFAGQSLKGPAGSVPILKLADTAEDMVEGKAVSAAGRCQGLALRHGKGRVVVMGEAAELSAQVIGAGGSPDNMMGMNVPGIDNRQMALNIMHWLSGLLEP
jgi:hypothetical protein